MEEPENRPGGLEEADESDTEEGTETPPAAAQEPAEGTEGSYLQEPPSVFDELGEMQAEARRDGDTKIIELLPGRFKGRLAVRVHRIDPKKRRRKARKIAKRGVTDEVELQYAAEVIAEATEAILYRPKEQDKLVEAQTLSESLGTEPIKWDLRLGTMLKMEDQLTGGETEAQIVRLVFRNREALDAFYQELNLWLLEADPTDSDDEDEEVEPSRPS